MLSLDFETRSTLNLTQVGVYAYATDPTTDIWCMAYAFDEEPVELWKMGDPVPERVREYVLDGDGELRAWNANFERIIWTFVLRKRYGFPLPARERFVCTAAEAAAMGLPRNLKDAGRVLRVDELKDTDGGKLAKQMAMPRRRRKNDPPGLVRWWDEPIKLAGLYSYCKQDVRTERAVAKKVRRLSPYERRVYLLDQTINDRGVRIDVPLVGAMTKAHDRAMDLVNEELSRITDGAVTKVSKTANLAMWLTSRGLDTNTVARPAVREMLGYADNPSDVQRALELRMEGGRSSLAKLERVPELINADHRVRGTLLYHGASTGRWAARLLQTQNFPRGEVADVESYIPLLTAGLYDEIPEPLLVVLSSLLRGIIRATPGNRLMSGDYSQIEARIVAWIAGQDDLVEAFAQGRKVYEEMATKIYDVPLDEVTKEQRQIAKNTVLGCGFQMGPLRFRTQVKEQAGIEIEPEDSRHAVYTWRDVNEMIVKFWGDIDRAARAATVRPGTWHKVGRRGMIRFYRHGRVLWCVLPSGRPLAYMDPRIEVDDEKKDRTNVVVSARDSITKQWRRQRMYGGFWTENVVQAMARDVMVHGMLALEEARYPIVMTVHDEVVSDVPLRHGTLEDFLSILKRGPQWAHDLPIAVEGWEGERYRK